MKYALVCGKKTEATKEQGESARVVMKKLLPDVVRKE